MSTEKMGEDHGIAGLLLKLTEAETTIKTIVEENRRLEEENKYLKRIITKAMEALNE